MKETYNIIKESLDQCLEQIQAYKKEKGVVLEIEKKVSRCNKNGPPEIHVPQESKTKGSGSRLISMREKTRERPRKCNGCGKKGVNHDRRNCPALTRERYSIVKTIISYYERI